MILLEQMRACALVRCVGDCSDLENNLINLDQRSEPDRRAGSTPESHSRFSQYLNLETPDFKNTKPPNKSV